MKKLASIIAFLILSTFATPASFAGTATANLSVSVAVDSGCVLTTIPLVFSLYSPVGVNATNPDDGTGAVVLTCTQGIVGSVGLNYGVNAFGQQRRVQSGSDTLNYSLYQDSARTTTWGNATPDLLVTVAAPNTSPRTYSVYGRLPAGQTAPSGTYTDVVVATVNF